MIEDGGARVHVYVAASYVPEKHAETDRMALFIKSSAVRSNERAAHAFVTASSPPQDIILNPVIIKLSVTFTAHLTNWIKSQLTGFHFSRPMFYDFLLVLLIVKVTFPPP